MPTDTYQCSKCKYSGSKFNCIKHFLIRHVPDHQVPYICNNCQFKALTEGKWKQHSETMLALAHEEHSCLTSKDPYRVTIGLGKDISRKSQENLNAEESKPKSTKSKKQYIEEPIGEEHFVPDYEDISDEEIVGEVVEEKENQDLVKLRKEFETEKMELKMLNELKIRALERELKEQKEASEKEKEELKRASTFEANRFGEFIQRIEKRKQELKKDNDNLTKQNSEMKDSIRTLEKELKDKKQEIVNLRTSLKRRETELKRLEDEDEEPPQKIKSVILKPESGSQPVPKRRLDFGHFHRY